MEHGFECNVCILSQDVHETAAGALWNLAFNPGNALRIVEEGGVPALVHLCASSVSKMARFMAALALAYMFDGRYFLFPILCSSLNFMLKLFSSSGSFEILFHFSFIFLCYSKC